jgi:hypothetical protein
MKPFFIFYHCVGGKIIEQVGAHVVKFEDWIEIFVSCFHYNQRPLVQLNEIINSSWW